MKRTLILAGAIAMVATACGTAAETTSSDAVGATGTATPATVVTPPGEIASLVRVFDGDSFEAEVNGTVVEVRMLGINAPEGYECHGDAARDRLRELLDDTDLTLVQDGEEDTDRFGRQLRSVYASGRLVNATMVAEGHAAALQGGDPEEATLVALSDAAFVDALGMWSPDACDETVDATVSVTEIEYDPKGRDWENKSEEWVVIRNDGDTAVDVAGWILRDESSSHRYEFPNETTMAPGNEIRIRTGCGDNRASDVYWCADDAVWSNGGDTVILQTAAGTVVDRVRYDGDY
ncbi:lamin tail domain-containing protein [Actinomycetota bacterium]